MDEDVPRIETDICQRVGKMDNDQHQNIIVEWVGEGHIRASRYKFYGRRWRSLMTWILLLEY